ncbi:TRAP transporter small permease [Pseudalkalibacillus sp. A8]|uniref:TRAP transporter small permease n=1 Tax=Pseudalkalibacillus sp. A8 TaxID=3382641 RepID=UPI0038B6AF04
MNILTIISNTISWISKILASIFIAALTIVLVVQVILRTFFDSGLAWSIEFSTFSVIWAVMIIANVLIKENEMINVDFFDHLLSENFKKIRNVVYQFVFILLLLVMTYYGWIQAIESANKTTPTLGISWFYAYLSIPLGTTLMLYQYLYKIVNNIVSIKEVR